MAVRGVLRSILHGGSPSWTYGLVGLLWNRASPLTAAATAFLPYQELCASNVPCKHQKTWKSDLIHMLNCAKTLKMKSCQERSHSRHWPAQPDNLSRRLAFANSPGTYRQPPPRHSHRPDAGSADTLHRPLLHWRCILRLHHQTRVPAAGTAQRRCSLGPASRCQLCLRAAGQFARLVSCHAYVDVVFSSHGISSPTRSWCQG